MRTRGIRRSRTRREGAPRQGRHAQGGQGAAAEGEEGHPDPGEEGRQGVRRHVLQARRPVQGLAQARGQERRGRRDQGAHRHRRRVLHGGDQGRRRGQRGHG